MGTLYSLLIRIELYNSGNRIITSENLNTYNLSVTLHGLIMIFFIIIPVLYGGLGNYLIPIYVLAPEISFPRINCLSLLILPFSYNYLLISLCTEFTSTTGWTFYPPLSTSLMNLSPVGIGFLIIRYFFFYDFFKLFYYYYKYERLWINCFFIITLYFCYINNCIITPFIIPYINSRFF